MNTLSRLILLLMGAIVSVAAQADVASPGSQHAAFSMVVMDPLAAPLSCPCVEGYAQRKYQVLGKQLEASLGRPVRVTFAESLGKALAKEGCDHADLIIGKDSVVRSDSQKAGYKVTAIGRLTDQEGRATQTGLIVVRSADSAQQVADLNGYRILFGPADCDEKFRAPRAFLQQAGVDILPASQAETSNACSDGACKIIEWGDKEKAAAVISSYAAPLLEGCGTIKQGDLRVVGETGPVPFITAFLTDRVGEEERKTVREALLSVDEHPELLVALESMLGFIELDEKYLRSVGRSTTPDKTDKPAKPPASKSTAWPGFLGPSRDGHVAWLPESLPREPKVTWEQPLLRPGMGGIAATDEHVILGDRDASNQLDVWRCFAADDGEKLWTVEYPALGLLDYDNLPRATPVVDGGRVYLLGAFGDLTCAELETGEVLWQVNLRVMFGAEDELVWGTCSTPLLLDGKLIVNPGAPAASLAALDPSTGDVAWQSPGGRLAYASPLVATLGGVEQIVAYDHESLGGWDPADGLRLWTLAPPLPGDFNVPTPVVVGDKLLLVSENNGARLHSFDAQGKIRQAPDAVNGKLKPDMSTPVVVSDRIFCVHEKIYCLDASTLKPLWVGGQRLLPGYAPLVASADRLLTVGQGGELLLIDPSVEGFRLVSHCDAFPGNHGTQLLGCPAIVGGRIYMRGEASVRCIDLSRDS
jgi:outer membrane protein assembly factor BamB/ABC-type phosphate/phosphonate transport system substrate-binding protein